MKLFFKKINKLNKGFTLVETLVAISIFTMSVVTAMSVLGGGIANTTYAKQKIIASYLAQEGIESIRNMRDSYELTASKGWTQFYGNLQLECTGGGCGINNLAISNDNNFVFQCVLLAANRCQLYLHNGNYQHNYGLGVDSGFTTTITVPLISPAVSPVANEIKVSSTVSWTQPSGTTSITFTENLFNWAE